MNWSEEIEIIKIGSIIPNIISKHEIKKERKDTIMIVSDGGPIFDHYVSILREKCGDDYRYLKASKSIVGTPKDRYKISKMGLNGTPTTDSIKGKPSSEPVVGIPFYIDTWSTSIVTKIIDNDILITTNSVYAIHDASKLRDKKLNDLGIY